MQHWAERVTYELNYRPRPLVPRSNRLPGIADIVEYHLLTAAAVISILPILVIFLALQRWVVQAVVMSGLKG